MSLLVQQFAHSVQELSFETIENIFSQGVVVDLRDPELKNGILSTQKGGVITAPNIRIQAQTIIYTHKVEDGVQQFRVEASDELMVEYGDRVFIGKSIEYDFNKQEGQILDGKTAMEPWYIGGSVIDLLPEGQYNMQEGYISTCENSDSEWQVSAKSVFVPKSDRIAANNIQLRFLKLPLFWMPSFRGNIKNFLRSPVKGQIHWGGKNGTRMSMRYRFLSQEKLNAFFRLDYRLKRGFGGGIDSNYESENVEFLTRNYLAHDVSIRESGKKRRYRFEGRYKRDLAHDFKLDFKYDRLSDSEVPYDFENTDFDLETAQRTECVLSKKHSALISSLRGRFRINPFQSLKQELPTLSFYFKPFSLAGTGIINDNHLRASYLSFEHANSIDKSYDFESSRFQAKNSFYRAFAAKPFIFVPKVGLVAAYYDKSPFSTPASSLTLLSEAELKMPMHKVYGSTKHLFLPYAHYRYHKVCKDGVDDHYIFDFEDSSSFLNVLEFGFRNSFFYKNATQARPLGNLNVYGNAFFNTSSISKKVPKVYTDASFSYFQNFLFALKSAWDSKESRLDYYNIEGKWTKSENLAVGVEYRSRGAYDWRKCYAQNFFLESLRSENELLQSALSDKRSTVLGNVFYRFTPTLALHFQSRHGMHRPNNPRYEEYQVDLLAALRCSWRLKISYRHSETDDRVSLNVRLDEQVGKKSYLDTEKGLITNF